MNRPGLGALDEHSETKESFYLTRSKKNANGERMGNELACLTAS